MPEISQSVWGRLGVYWGTTPGLPADHPHPAAAAGAHGRAGSQTAPVWRLTWNCGTTQHHSGPGKDFVPNWMQGQNSSQYLVCPPRLGNSG